MSRSIPRLAPGARLGAHRAGTLTLVSNDGPVAPQRVDEEAPAEVQVDPATPSNGDVPTSPGRAAGRRSLRPALWLSDCLVPERNSFGVLRLLMALAVLVSHAFFLASGDHTAEPLYRWTGYTLGQHGVQVFFFLSGILVAQSLMKSESVRDYAVARGLRIFPALIVCVLATAVVIGPWLTTLPPVEYLKDKAVAAYIVKTLSLMTGSAPLPGLFETSPGAAKGVVNSSLWTLKYEVLCYVALAVVGWVAIRTKAYRAVAAAAIAGWLALVLYQRVGIELGSQKSALDIFRYFALFFGAGATAFVLRRWIPIHGLVLVPLVAGAVLSIGTRFAEPAMAVALGYGALWLSTFEFWGLRGYTNHSDYSYGIYIYAMPVSQALVHFVPGVHPVSLALITTGLALFLAFLSWEVVERPALALRHRFSRKTAVEEIKSVAAEEPTVPVAADAETTTKVTPIDRRPVKPQAVEPAAAAMESQPKNKVSETEAQAIEPGVARPWRPVSSPIRLQVARETGEARGPSEGDVKVPDSRLSLALNRMTTTVPRTAKSANDAMGTPPDHARKASDLETPREPRGPRPVWRPLRPIAPEKR